MRSSFIFRIVLYAALGFSVINGWWFIALPVVAVGMWRYSFVFETIAAGAMYDALFGMEKGMGLIGYIGTISAIVIVAAVYPLKRVVR